MSDTSHFEFRIYEEQCATEFERQRPFMLLQPKIESMGELWRVTGFLAFCEDEHEFLNLEWEQV